MTGRDAAFVLTSSVISDAVPLAGYAEQIPATVARYGGRILVVGAVTALEGDAPTVATLLEFPDAVAAATWYDSPGYAAIRGLRQACGPSRVWLIEPAPRGPGPTPQPNVVIPAAGDNPPGS